MKNILKISVAFLGLALLFTACTPAENELGPLMAKSALKFSITPSATDSNLIILKSLTPGVTPQWITPIGRSTRVQDSVKIAFPGTYKFIYGVESSGGIVQADTFTLVIRTTNLTYVNDPLWTMICGGVGQEKTWVLDIDAAGVSKYFTGPKFFEGSEESWNSHLLRAGGMLDPAIAAQLGATPANIWEWAAAWSGNTWVMPAADYGTMTFDLKNNAAHVTVNHLTIPALGTQNGTFLLDVTKHTLMLNNAVIIHNSGSEADAKGGYGNANVLTLTENTMQLNIPGSGSYNFISKAYADSWKPSNPVDPNFNFGTVTQKDILSAGTKSWKLDLEVPYSWYDLNGKTLDPLWISRAVIIATGWAPYGDADVAGIQNASITFTPNGSVVVKQNDGTLGFGTYAVDEPTNNITFSGITPTIPIASYIIATPSANDKFKILSVEQTGTTVTGIWLGQRDPAAAQYLAFHFVIR
jgi:hypothetical protein